MTRLFASLLIFLSATICFASEGLNKTSFAEFENKNYSSIGVTVSLPKSSKNLVERKYDGSNCRNGLGTKGTIVIFMHPFSFGALDESEFFLTFTFEKLTKDNFDAFLRGQHGCVNDWCLGHNGLVLQDAIGMRKAKAPLSPKEYLCFRRDIKLPSGDFVIAHAKLLNAPSENLQQDKDIEIIKKVLDSVKPL